MKISHNPPPNLKDIMDVLDIKDKLKDIIFTYGDTIFNVPEGYQIPEHLAKHEFIHSKQQGDDPKGWWEKYLKDKDFRIGQELEAYSVQYKHVKDTQKRKVSDRFLNSVSYDLSSVFYGNIMSFIEAQTKIRRLAKEII